MCISSHKRDLNTTHFARLEAKDTAAPRQIYGAIPMFDSKSALSVFLYIETNITVRQIDNQLTTIHPPDFHIQLMQIRKL